MNKKIIISVLATLLTVSSLFGAAYASGVIKIVVNGQKASTDVAPRMVNGRVMVPISFVSKALGADVSWNQQTQTVTVNSIGIPHADVWKESIPISQFDVAGINNTVQVFMSGKDQGDEVLLKRSVTSDMDVELLKQQHFSMGPNMLSMQIADIKVLKIGSPKELPEFKVRVAIQTWLDTTTINYWDLTVVQTSGYDYNPDKMPYLVKSSTLVKSMEVSELSVYPGFTYNF